METNEAVRVLLVDDDHDGANSTAMLLRHFGAEAHAVYDARLACDEASSVASHWSLLDMLKHNLRASTIGARHRPGFYLGGAMIESQRASNLITDEAAFDLPRLSRYFSELSPQPMLAVEGASHVVRHLNAAFARLAGKNAEELIGRPFADAVPEGEANGCLALLDRVFRTAGPKRCWSKRIARRRPPLGHIRCGPSSDRTNGRWA